MMQTDIGADEKCPQLSEHAGQVAGWGAGAGLAPHQN